MSNPTQPPSLHPLPTDRDLVCGMTVNSDSPHQADHDGHRLRFCSKHCLDKFNAAPRQYLPAPGKAGTHVHHGGHSHSIDQASAAITDSGAEFTCPMHPEILQIGPGTCPKCGMALEPVMPDLEEEENPELKDFTRRF